MRGYEGYLNRWLQTTLPAISFLATSFASSSATLVASWHSVDATSFDSIFILCISGYSWTFGKSSTTFTIVFRDRYPLPCRYCKPFIATSIRLADRCKFHIRQARIGFYCREFGLGSKDRNRNCFKQAGYFFVSYWIVVIIDCPWC